jgi:hypothetical protein
MRWSAWILFFCSVFVLRAEAPSADNLNITIQAPVSELLDGYAQLEGQHPEKFVAGKSNKWPLPTVDLYDDMGKSIEFGGNCYENSAFVGRLAAGIGKDHLPVSSFYRPSLPEALAFFSELARQAKAWHSDKIYTLIAVSYPDDGPCEVQNKAVNQLMLKKHDGLRVIRVLLHV